MKRLLQIIIILTLVLNLIADENDVWNQAEQILRKSNGLIPGTFKNTTLVKDKKGKVKNSFDVTINYSISEGNLITEFKEGNRNGESLTADDKDVKKMIENPSFDIKDNEIFFDKIIENKFDENEIIDGKTYSVFSYSRGTDGEEVEVGKIWLNKEDGTPLKREFSIDPLPKKVKDLSIEINYGEDEDRNVFVSMMKTNVKASFMLMKFNMESTQELSDYFWKKAIPSE